MSYISSRIHNNNEVLVWERCPITNERIIKSYEAPYYFYVDDPEGTIQTIYDTSVTKLTFKDSKTAWKAKQECNNNEIRMWESDIGPELRVLSNEYYKIPAPKLNITHLDIEVDYDEKRGFSSPKDPYAPINSIALHHEHKREMVVIVVPHPEDPIKWTNESLEKACNNILEIPSDEYSMTFYVVESEKELLLQFLDEIEDSDLLSTWNGERFDYPYLAGRIQMILGEYHFSRLSFPEGDLPILEEKIIKPKGEDNNSEQKFQDSYMELRTSGRLLADYMLLYKKYEMSEKPSYKLSAISDDVLVDDNDEPILPKLEYEGTLFGLYRTNLAFFVRYNIRDTEILHGFEKVLGYIEVANQNYHLSCGQFTHVLGTLKLAELAIVNHCHHELKKVVNTTTFPEIDRSIEGALVLLPQVGLQELLGSIDMTSLYPTCIRLLNASPETMIGQFIEEFKTPDLLAKCDDYQLTIKLMDKTRITKTSREWNQILRENNWSVSGYGTVFDQNKEGVIPAILTYWFNMRIEYKNHMKTAGKYMAKILSESDGTGDQPRGDKGILLTAEQAKHYDEQKQLYEYNDRLQYVYKIKLNSLYGALSNQWFRFYRLELAESTTSTGRMMLKHQCRKVNELLEGKYDIDFPTYLDPDDAIESGHPATTALHGPKFNGKYQTETVVYGDTDSTYFKTHANNIEDAIKIADLVADAVNKSFPEYIQRTFFTNDANKELLKTAREIVSDRGIFVEKKRYILHIADSEGKRVDKMKIMGLDTKKTTLPVHVSKKLNKFIERLLKGETWGEISESVVEYKEALINAKNVMDIGLPKGVKKVEQYTEDYKYDHKTRLPGHVAGAIFYNQCLEEFDDRISLPITSGMKIKVFRLKGVHNGRFKCISIPTDADFVPEWFLENFIIDKPSHIERLVDNPLQNILKAIGERTPSRDSLIFESAWEF